MKYIITILICIAVYVALDVSGMGENLGVAALIGAIGGAVLLKFED